MHVSAFSDLTSPGLATMYAMWDALIDIGRLAGDDGLPDRAARSGVRHILEDRLPPMSASPDFPPGRLAPGSTAADAAGMISGHLQWNPGPATTLLAELAQASAAIEIDRAASRPLTAADNPADLDAAPGDRCYEREGTMTAGDLAAARTRLLLITGRIPPGAMEAILGGEPCGTVLEPYGMRRGRRKVHLDRGTATVDASAALYLGNTPVGTAAEHVTRQFCEHIARTRSMT